MPTPPSSASTVDLTTSGNVGTVNDAVFSAEQINAGTGSFPAFLSITHNGTESGYNSDFRPVQFNETTNANHNHSLLLANIPIVEGDGTGGTVEGVLYREFLFDANEPNSGDNPLLSLDRLQIWQEEAGNLTNFNTVTGFAGIHTNHLAYDLDAGGDHWIAINSNLSSGSGKSDVRVLIPNTFFDPNAPYVYLYSLFGAQGDGWATGNGNEEWAIRNGHSGPGGGSKAALNISKAATVPGGTADTAGEDISYSITVANTGNVNLTGVVVADPFVSSLIRVADQVGNNDNILNVGEIWAYTAHHTVTQEDIDSLGDSGINNTATAGSNETGLGPTQLDHASATVPVDSRPHVTLDKAGAVADGSADSAGDIIHYTISVTNDGNTTLTGVVVTDSTINIVTPVLDHNAPITNPNVQLFTPVTDGDGNLGDNNNNGIDEPTDHNGVKDPGETWQFVYPGDLNSDGRHDPGETWVAYNLGDTNNSGSRDIGETFVGDSNNNGIEDDGEAWQFKNLGDTNHNNLQDTGETWQYSNAGDDNRNGVQDPGETFQYANVGDTNQNGAEDAGETFQFYNAGDTNHNGVEDDGETFQFTVNNSPDPVSTNPPFNDGDTNQDGKLSVGETWHYAYDHTVTQDEIDNRNGSGIPTVQPGLAHNNTASVDTDQNATSSDSVSIPIVQHPVFSIHKTVTDVGGDGASGHVNAAGDVISYTITITNTGNMTMTGVSLSDPLLTGTHGTLSGATESSSANGELNVGETWTYTGTYTAQQSDINNNGGGDGDIDNTATAHTTQQPTNLSSSTETPIDRNPAYSILKTVTDVGGDGAAGHVNAAGDVISYHIVVSNNGNVDLTGTSVIDALLTGPNGTLSAVSGDTTDVGTLNVGEVWTLNGTYTAQQSDIDNNGGGDGDIDNTATVQSDELADQSSSTATPIDRIIGLALVKSGTWMDGPEADGFADAGEHISYVFHVTNTGNVTQTNVQVGDLDGAVTVTGGFIGSIAPGVTNSSATGDYEILQFDVDNGYFDNEGVANSDFSNATDTEHVILPQHPPSQAFMP
jgi:uncharacterized repeat protein (TIGR01451 family)